MLRSSSLLALLLLLASFVIVGCGGSGGGGGGVPTGLPVTIRLVADPRGYELDQGRIQMVIQENTVANPVNVVVSNPTSVPNDPLYIPNTGVTIGNAPLLKPVSLRLRYNVNDLPAGTNQNNIRVVKLEGNQWVLVNNSDVNVDARRVTADVSSFGTFGLRVVNPD
jgi:hypothetical protein